MAGVGLIVLDGGARLDAVGGPWWGNCAWDAVGIAAVTDPGAPVADQIVPAPGDRCRDLLGREAFSLFPDNPHDPAANGVKAVRTSMETPRATPARPR